MGKQKLSLYAPHGFLFFSDVAYREYFPQGAARHLLGAELCQKHIQLSDNGFHFVPDPSTGKGVPIVGVAYCRVLIHRENNMRNFPLLGYRYQKKMYYIFCRRCLEVKNSQKPCRCSDADRSFEGYFCLPEIAYALNKLKGHQVRRKMELELDSRAFTFTDNHLRSVLL